MFKEHNVKKLPDAYRKDKDSNNYTNSEGGVV